MMNRIFLLIREQTRGNAELIKWMQEKEEKRSDDKVLKIEFLAERLAVFGGVKKKAFEKVSILRWKRLNLEGVECRTLFHFLRGSFSNENNCVCIFTGIPMKC